MKHFSMLREATWWTWLVTEGLLVAGALGFRAAFGAAILVALAQFAYFASTDDEKLPLAAQVRLGFAIFVAGADASGAVWLIWMLIAGTAARIAFGYCLLGRILSLFPWNRDVPLTQALMRRTFLTSPAHVAPEQSPAVVVTALDPCASGAAIAATVAPVRREGVSAMERAVREVKMRRIRMALDWCQVNPACSPRLTDRQEIDLAS